MQDRFRMLKYFVNLSEDFMIFFDSSVTSTPPSLWITGLGVIHQCQRNWYSSAWLTKEGNNRFFEIFCPQSLVTLSTCSLFTNPSLFLMNLKLNKNNQIEGVWRLLQSWVITLIIVFSHQVNYIGQLYSFFYVFSPVGDHILQEFNTLYLTRLEPTKLPNHPKQKLRSGGGRKVLLQINFVRWRHFAFVSL